MWVADTILSCLVWSGCSFPLLVTTIWTQCTRTWTVSLLSLRGARQLQHQFLADCIARSALAHILNISAYRILQTMWPISIVSPKTQTPTFENVYFRHTIDEYSLWAWLAVTEFGRSLHAVTFMQTFAWVCECVFDVLCIYFVYVQLVTGFKALYCHKPWMDAVRLVATTLELLKIRKSMHSAVRRNRGRESLLLYATSLYCDPLCYDITMWTPLPQRNRGNCIRCHDGDDRCPMLCMHMHALI